MALVCKLCQLEKPLINAHLLPRKYFREMYKDSSKKHLIVITTGEHPERKISQSGVYDQAILCKECDNKLLGRSDDYAYEVLPPQHDPAKLLQVEKGLEVYQLGSIDSDKLKRFLIGTLWRFHVTMHPLGEFIELGHKYANSFRECLLGTSDNALKDVGCVVNLFLHPRYPQGLVLTPFRHKFGGVNGYVLYMPPWKLWVRVDRRPFESPYSGTEIRTGRGGVALVLRDFSQGEQMLLKHMQDQIRAHHGLQKF